MKAIGIVLLLLSLCIMISLSVRPTLTPDNVHSCVGRKITLTCTVTQETAISWLINFVDRSISDIQHSFLESDHPGQTLNITNNRHHIFTFMLKTRFVSTVTTNVMQDLEGTSVSCEDLSTTEIDMSQIHIINETSVSSFPSVVYNEPMENSISINVNWYPNSNIASTIGTQSISVNPPTEVGSNFNTTNSSVQLIVLYNQKYNINVTASNCAGNGSLIIVDFQFSIGHCSYPNTNPNVSIEGYENGLEDSQISYYCQSGFLPNERMVANCTGRGIWEPNPAELICQAKCTSPELSKYVEVDLTTYPSSTIEGSTVIFHCIEGFIPNVTIISTCTREGKWTPDPLMHQCEPFQDLDFLKLNNAPNSITSVIWTGVVCSVVMLIIGLLCGIATKMIIDLKRKKYTANTSNVVDAPAEINALYEDICINTSSENDNLHFNMNQAYGHVSTSTLP